MPLIDRETPLGEILEQLADHPYVLATNSDGQIAGIVSAEHICERLESCNLYERRRWQQMPLSSLLNVSFARSAGNASVVAGDSAECVAITEGDRIFGLVVDDDVFLSWRRLESLVSVALSDPLTGLMNRLAYERRLAEEWCRALRTGMSLAVVVVDLDSFKRVNDTLGHPAGDAVLCAIAQELEASMRSYDVVARLGGDEFVALCLGCSEGDISIPIERIQQGISQMEIQYQETAIPMTVSIGAAVRHDGFDTSDPGKLFAAADECLYHAKGSDQRAWKVEFGANCPGVVEPVRFDENQMIHRPVNSSESSRRTVSQAGEHQ